LKAWASKVLITYFYYYFLAKMNVRDTYLARNTRELPYFSTIVVVIYNFPRDAHTVCVLRRLKDIYFSRFVKQQQQETHFRILV
jgi:hypothetical protein